jgi:signal transduction histidine kinase
MTDEKPLMKKRSIILYWLLLILPTLVIGGVGIVVLRDEQERLIELERASARDRARAIADSLQITVEAVEHDLSQALHQIPRAGMIEALLDWKETNPLIRNVFIWKRDVGLVYPSPRAPESDEESMFIARYRTLFSGRVPWIPKGLAAPETDRPAEATDRMPRSQNQSLQQIEKRSGKLQSMKRGRLDLQQLARTRSQRSHDQKVSSTAATRPTDGWIPWFSDNKLHILGWTSSPHAGIIYGVEMEIMTLLSRLVVDFPESDQRGVVYALVDDGGNILHQAGAAVVEPGEKPEISVSLAPHLPHWQIAVYFSDQGPLTAAGRGFVILMGLLLAIFIAAIVVGGTLLTRQAYASWLDAQQKSSFVSNVSHELKTPLTSIRMYAELLSENRIKDPEKRARYLHVIASESRRLGRLVNNVLNFGRLEQGRMTYHREELELTGFLNEIIEEHRVQVERAGLVLETRIPVTKYLLKTDRDALKQALINTIDNAVKYAASGGALTIVLEVDHEEAEIRVMDRGPGVPATHRESIFEKFQRVDDSLTTRQPGVGLGLTIARGIMRDLGGDLRFERRDGGGSCFTFQIPLESVDSVEVRKEGNRRI